MADTPGVSGSGGSRDSSPLEREVVRVAPVEAEEVVVEAPGGARSKKPKRERLPISDRQRASLVKAREVRAANRRKMPPTPEAAPQYEPRLHQYEPRVQQYEAAADSYAGYVIY